MTVLAACAPAVSPHPSLDRPSSTATSTPGSSPAATTSVAPDPSGPAGLSLPDPGRPFDAEAIRAILEASRRPDGVPSEALASGVLAALADAIWTIDGRPWQTADAGGTCGPQTCQLEIAGTRDGAAGDDLWVVEIDRTSATARVTTAVLQAIPDDLETDLDRLARDLVPAGALDGAVPTGVRWLPPPDGGTFILSYRTAGSAGGCGLDVTLDAVAPEVVDVAVRSC